MLAPKAEKQQSVIISTSSCLCFSPNFNRKNYPIPIRNANPLIISCKEALQPPSPMFPIIVAETSARCARIVHNDAPGCQRRATGGSPSSSTCPARAMEESDDAIVATIAGESRSRGDHVRKVAASIGVGADCVRAIGSPSSSTYVPSHTMEDGVAAKEVSAMG